MNKTEKRGAIHLDVNAMSRKALLLMVLLLPPIGTFLLWQRNDVPRWSKVCALLYTAAVILFLLTWRAPACGTEIEAQQWSEYGTVSAASVNGAALTAFFML